MNNSPSFEKTFLAPISSTLDFDFWNTVMDTYESQNHKGTIHAVLDYIRPGTSKQSIDGSGNIYKIPHGSMTFHLEIRENTFFVSAPFLRLPEKNTMAILRQCAELNFSTLVLAQIVLKNDQELHFEHESPLALCEPYKLYRLFEEICIQADAHDDLFVEKFGAVRIQGNMQVTPYDAEELDKAWEKFQAYLQEGIQYADHFEGKRIAGFAWDSYYTTILKIDYFVRPQGFMKSEVEKTVKALNQNSPINELNNKAKTTFQKWLGMSKEKFAESMYKSPIFISEKPRMDLAGVQNYLKNTHENSKNEISKNDFTGATFTLLVGYLALFYYQNIPINLLKEAEDALAEACGKTWSETANSLWAHLDKVMKATESLHSPI